MVESHPWVLPAPLSTAPRERDEAVPGRVQDGCSPASYTALPSLGSSASPCAPCTPCTPWTPCSPCTPYTPWTPCTPCNPCTPLSRAWGLQGSQLEAQPPPRFVAVNFPAKQCCPLTALANWSKLICARWSFSARGLFPCIRDEGAAPEPLCLWNYFEPKP